MADIDALIDDGGFSNIYATAIVEGDGNAEPCVAKAFIHQPNCNTEGDNRQQPDGGKTALGCEYSGRNIAVSHCLGPILSAGQNYLRQRV